MSGEASPMWEIIAGLFIVWLLGGPAVRMLERLRTGRWGKIEPEPEDDVIVEDHVVTRVDWHRPWPVDEE